MKKLLIYEKNIYYSVDQIFIYIYIYTIFTFISKILKKQNYIIF